MTDEAAFLAALKANPADDTTRLVYADWLDEHNEPQKAEYLRLVVACTLREGNLVNTHESRLLSIAKELSSDWREAAGSRFSLILLAFHDQVQTIEWVRELTGEGLGGVKEAIDNLPHMLLSFVTFEYAQAVTLRSQSISGLDVQITPSDAEQPDGPANYELVAYCCTPRYIVGDTTEARAALVKFLMKVTSLSEQDAERQAALNTPIVYRKCLTRQQARSERSTVADALPPYRLQSGWWISVACRCSTITHPNV